MELKWLEDYLTLAEKRSFSKAAQARSITQPAFSRRIRSLENWLGVSLVDRTKYPASLTRAGEEFVKHAQRLKADICASRDDLQVIANVEGPLVLLLQHSLAVSTFPFWMCRIEPMVDPTQLRIIAGDLHDILDSFLAGSGDLLLCFSTPALHDRIRRADVESIDVGADELVPVSAVDGMGRSKFAVARDIPFRYLSYTEASFFGQLVAEHCLPQLENKCDIRTICESALAEGLKALVEAGCGVAWLPRSLVRRELQAQRMKVLSPPLPSVGLKITIFRFKEGGSKAAGQLWDYVAKKAAGSDWDRNAEGQTWPYRA